MTRAVVFQVVFLMLLVLGSIDNALALKKNAVRGRQSGKRSEAKARVDWRMLQKDEEKEEEEEEAKWAEEWEEEEEKEVEEREEEEKEAEQKEEREKEVEEEEEGKQDDMKEEEEKEIDREEEVEEEGNADLLTCMANSLVDPQALAGSVDLFDCFPNLAAGLVGSLIGREDGIENITSVLTCIGKSLGCDPTLDVVASDNPLVRDPPGWVESGPIDSPNNGQIDMPEAGLTDTPENGPFGMPEAGQVDTPESGPSDNKPMDETAPGSVAAVRAGFDP